MKQFTFEYTNQTQLTSNLDRVANWAEKNGVKNIWIRVFVTEETGDCFFPIADAIDLCMPEAKYMITHAGYAFDSGNVSSAPAIIVCNLFEDPTTQIELFQYNFSEETYTKTVDDIIDYVNANPWIKLISFNAGANLEGIRHLNKLTASINPNIEISGAAAATTTMTLPAKAFSSAGKISTSPLIVTYIGGENFHARTDVIVGWTGIGKEFTITKSEGQVIYEIDNAPAFDLYKKYLKIESAPGFIVDKTIEFPLCFEDSGVLFLRCPFLLNEDGSMTMMMNDLKVGDKVQLSFGSPDVILEDISSKMDEVATFEPQIISVNSCLGRYFFWGDNLENETSIFDKVASSSGFLTGGEMIRRGDHILILNETIVTTAMREGEKSPDGSGIRKIDRREKDYSLTQRLAAFIDTVTADLEEYNQIVKRMAITDELTMLNNRRELDRIVKETIAAEKPFSLLMMDADNFKQINDTYGHKEGDKVLTLLADTIRELIGTAEGEIYAGRWGGDEFMLIFVNDNSDNKNAVHFAAKLQKQFHSDTVYDNIPRTVSIGIAHTENETDRDIIFQKVDKKLYAAKTSGKGCIIA